MQISGLFGFRFCFALLKIIHKRHYSLSWYSRTQIYPIETGYSSSFRNLVRLVISGSSPCMMPHDSHVKSRPPTSRSYKPTRKINSPQNALRAVFSGRHLTCTIPWLIQKTQGPVTPSTTLSTKGSFVLFPSVGLPNPIPFRRWDTPMPVDGRHRSHKPTRQKTNAQYALQVIHIYL